MSAEDEKQEVNGAVGAAGEVGGGGGGEPGGAPAVGAAPAPAPAPEGTADPAPLIPSAYSFDGIDLDSTSLGEFAKHARANKMTQDQAYEAVRGFAESAAVVAQRKEKVALAAAEKALRADPEFGGDKYDGTLKAARDTLDALGGSELVDEADKMGFARSPQLVKALARLAASGVVAGKFIKGGANTGPGERSVAELFYGDSMNLKGKD